MCEWREFAAAGGLISYGTNLTGVYHQLGIYAGGILKGGREKRRARVTEAETTLP